MAIKLEVGKTYLNGWGRPITIVEGPNDTCRWFRDHLGYNYHQDGVMARRDMDHRFNLVSTRK